MADEEHLAGAVTRVDERARFVEARRHRLLDEHVLARGQRSRRVREVQLGGRPDVHRVDVGAVEHRFDRCVRLDSMLRRDFDARALDRLGDGRQSEAGVREERGTNARPAAPNPTMPTRTVAPPRSPTTYALRFG
jgi:hypothetical protein